MGLPTTDVGVPSYAEITCCVDAVNVRISSVWHGFSICQGGATPDVRVLAAFASPKWDVGHLSGLALLVGTVG